MLVMDDNNTRTAIVLTDEQKRRRRARSIAIALHSGACASLLRGHHRQAWPGVMQRPL